jgi:hypothetical protein
VINKSVNRQNIFGESVNVSIDSPVSGCPEGDPTGVVMLFFAVKTGKNPAGYGYVAEMTCIIHFIFPN